MFLNKRKVILVISISLLVFFFTYKDVKPQILKVVDGDTIHLNGDKIRFLSPDEYEFHCHLKKNTNKTLIKGKSLLNTDNTDIHLSNNTILSFIKNLN